jgi:exosome complex component RRP41
MLLHRWVHILIQFERRERGSVTRLNGGEEQELPFLTVATLGESDRVVVLVCETRVQVGRLEGMLAVGVDGCKQVRSVLDGVVRERGGRVLEEGKL